ncbi:ribosomal protein S18-alanine N-acetyltransferase [Alteromonas sp. a30]|uniref:ribosomal protein S18-alanine N-acetyltransferase n=1 Tax=Alteromonas sp. a30 TaxID=2730917 RepID=UPI002282ADD4|nr:ribosomal protein S18-alanine N-acetyltransferase [Alteromonas sp. a30]MCY7296656.1 ribosomal protein S18-alanine N-acetyltransferase [Alteromonas sp. a30]
MPDQPQIDVIPPSQYQDAFQLQLNCHVFPWSEGQFADCLTEPYFGFQLLQNEQIVGYYIGLKVSVEVTLMDIGIDQSERGKGFGKMLLQHFLRESNRLQAHEAWLEVRVSNITAIALYHDMGFEEIERRKNYYPTENGKEDAIIMRLILGQ